MKCAGCGAVMYEELVVVAGGLIKVNSLSPGTVLNADGSSIGWVATVQPLTKYS